jgi:hypothetical protein
VGSTAGRYAGSVAQASGRGQGGNKMSICKVQKV